MDEPIAKARREALHAPYDPEPLIARIKDCSKNTMRVTAKPLSAQDWIIRPSAVSYPVRNPRCTSVFCWLITLG